MMLTINPENTRFWAENETMRSMFGKVMAQLAKEDPRIVLLVADSGRMCKAEQFFVPEYPTQYVECGISEQNMIGIAAGLARSGRKPVVFAFSPFITERCLEQIRLDIAYAGLGVTLVGADAGIAQATLGVTHYGWEDAAVLRVIPGMTILCPADHAELVKCLYAAINAEKPTYIRLTGGAGKPSAIYTRDYSFEPGKGIELSKGKDVQIFASGTILDYAQKAAELLAARDIDAGITDMHTLKPLDKTLIIQSANRVSRIVTVEELNIAGGLGTAVAEVLAENTVKCRLIRIALPDRYPTSVSTYACMMDQLGLTPEKIAHTILTSFVKG